MKNLFVLSAVVLVVGMMGCKDDPVTYPFDPDVMHYDGVNNDAPVLLTGAVETAVQFGKDAMDFYNGKKIDAVSVFLFEVPSSFTLVFYAKGSGNSPGAELYSQSYSDGLQANGWNTVPFTTPLDLPSDEIWIGYRIADGGNVKTIGCDAGPGENGGDWIWEASAGEWTTFLDKTDGQVDINWNIRASVID